MIQVEGLNKLLTNLNKIEDEIKKEASEALIDTMADISEESLKICPKDTGELRKSLKGSVNGKDVIQGSDSGSVSRSGSEVNSEVLEGVISYDTPYAVRQHEVKAKNYTTSGTTWKYLETPFNKGSKKLTNNIKVRLGRIIK